MGRNGQEVGPWKLLSTLTVDYQFDSQGPGVSHEQQWLQLWTNTHKHTLVIGRRSSFSFRAASPGRA